MPSLRLSTYQPPSPLRVDEPTGTPLTIPLPHFRCLARITGALLPRDAILDTGSPLSWIPEEIWSRLSEGTDYEVLPWSSGFVPPPGRTAGWNFTYRIARLLQPLALFNLTSNTELVRDQVIVQLTDGNPPIPSGSQKPAIVIIGLWGGILENTNLRISTDPASGHVIGSLEW
jgi:hypothetical protein